MIKTYQKIKPAIILVMMTSFLALLGGLSYLYLRAINDVKVVINESQNSEDVMKSLDTIFKQAEISIGIIIAVFVIMFILFSAYLTRFMIYPKNRFIKGDERRELRDKLNEVSARKNQIETILLHMTDGVIAFNRNGQIISINPAAKKFLSISPENETFDDIFDKFNLDINMEKVIYLENWTSTEQTVQVDENYAKVIFAPFKDKDERVAGVIAVIQDITEHVKLDSMQKELVADVSHELKTPITSIMGYADTLLEGGYDAETQHKFLNVISSESKRMARLVTDLLTLSRYDNNRNSSRKETFDLGELVKQCQERLAIEIKKKGHKVTNLVTADVPPVYADRDDIERVVLNIMTNSIKYTPDEGEIKIYVGFVYNDAYIKIIDNGIGIPEDDLTRIFERFYRVDKARTREMGGTGLGLSIAKEILDKNGGSIAINSKVGEGTEVVIKIPTKKQ